MKTLLACCSAVCLLTFQTLTFHTNNRPFEDPLSPNQLEIQRNRDAQKDGFEKAKNLLIHKNVPFDPEILLTPDWRKTLQSTFDQMPELQEVRRGTKRLKGVQMAHTLYLPEKVQLEGDTVILVRNLIFDGHEAVIRGPFSIYVYPVDQSGLLGTSYEAAFARARPQSGGVRFTTASWAGSRANRGLPVMPIIRGGTITINTSGLGRADWLESQRAMARRSGSVRMIKAGFFQQGENKNGAYGGDGAWGVEGAQGSTGSPGTTGGAGTCGSSSSVNGGTGGNGNQGGNGLPGGSAATDPSLNGGRGGDAGTINFNIPDNPTGNYIFTARGGDGGWGDPVEKGGRAALVVPEGPAGSAPTAIVTRAVLAPADPVALVVRAVLVAPGVLAAAAASAATATT